MIPGTERDSTTGNDDDDGPRPHMRGQRTAAMRVLDGLVDGNQLPARSAEAVEALTRTGSPIEQDWTARVVQATGSRDYLKAFSRLVADPNRGHLLWTPQEQEAFRRVEQLRAETRALSTVDSAGGYLSPLQLDPAVLITSAGNVNPLRQISRVVQTVSDTWNGVTSAGVTAEWLAEAAEASDASPTFAQPSIPVFKQSAFIPFSYEIAQDATNFTQEIGKLLVDGLDQLSATAYTTGSGTGQPTGIITALAASSPTVVVNTATPDTLVAGDVYALQNALPPRFSTNAQWCAALPIHNMLRQMETANGALRFPGLHDNPATLLGRTANELSNMDSVIDAGQTNYVLVYGSFEHFVIVDRFPSTLELIPNLFGANRRPTGQRGMFLWARTGSDSVVDNAFRLLQA
ncbi:phage major capsid protein [Mycobacterium sp. 1274761.0]|uniref:phage major capsid protein n=1 Tax=Mycobacterium sp. 1274761.0 TaxID=1834077 RepID=UPI001E5C6103|nr:phage major capsid protein [Mycobacterium sp. 1274761.0]